jgi:type III secretion system YscI/HrpB-like protein
VRQSLRELSKTGFVGRRNDANEGSIADREISAMTALSLAHLGGGGGATLTEALRSANSLQKTAAFEDALARNGVAAPQSLSPPVQAVASSAAVPPTVQPVQADPGFENSAVERNRVRQSLELDGAPPAATSGDTILGGIQKLRGIFDSRHAQLNEVMQGNAADTQTLLTMQMEVAQYTLLIDVSSKLTGKATQSLDTLMKGQ